MAKKESKTELDLLMEKYGAFTGVELQQYESRLPVLSTGIFGVDLACGAICPETGCGGFRNRDLVEVMGLAGHGKTAFAESLIRTTQQRYPHKASVVAVFTEPPDTKRMSRVGIDIANLVILGCYAGERVKTAADLLDAVVDFASKDFVKLVIIDSVAMLFTEAEREKDVAENQSVAALAKVFNPFVKKYLDNAMHAPLVYLNHYRQPIQISFMAGPQPSVLNPSTAGGVTKDYMSRIRILAKASPLWRKSGKEKILHSETGRPIQDGLEITYTLLRNKYSNMDGNRPVLCELTFADSRFNTEAVTLNYANHFSQRGEDGELSSILTPQVLQKGAWYYIGDKKCNGTNQAIAYLRENPAILHQIQAQIMPRSAEFFADKKSFAVEDTLEVAV